MRIRLEFDAAVELGSRAAFRKSLIAVPPSLNIISDLSHYLHHSFLLPPQSIVLTIDGFSLFPAQRIADILHDDDLLCIRSAAEAPSAKRRKVTQNDNVIFPSLTDVSMEQSTLTSPKIPKCHIKTTNTVQIRAALEPLPEVALPYVLPLASRSGDVSGTERLVTVDKHGIQPTDASGGKPASNVGKSAACKIKKAVFPKPATPVTSIGRAMNQSLPISDNPARTVAPTDGDARASSVHQVTTIPDPAAPELWKPIARQPVPGECIRFRTMSKDGLSTFRAAECISVEDVDGSLFCTLRCAEGPDECVAFDHLLQLSVNRLAPGVEVPLLQPEPSLSSNGVQPDGGSVEVAKPLPCLPNNDEVNGARREDIRQQNRPTEDSLLSKTCKVPEANTDECLNEFSQKKLARLTRAVQRQFDYYFGDANYATDNFLRNAADEQGWTSLKLVSSFNRMQALTKDLDFVRTCLRSSEIVELSDCGKYVRKRGTA